MDEFKDFSQLVSETYRSLIIYLKYLRIPDSEIEDIAQDAYVKAYVAFARYQPDRPFKSWLFAIAKNLCIDHFKKLKKRSQYLKQNFIKDYTETFEEDSDNKRNIKDFISKLSAKEQLFIELRFFQGLPFKEIAEITGFTEASIKMKLMRILRILKEKLTNGMTP